MNKISGCIKTLFRIVVCACMAFTTWKAVRYWYAKHEKKPVETKE